MDPAVDWRSAFVPERFVGIACSPSGLFACAFCLDELGEAAGELSFPWSASKVRQFLLHLKANLGPDTELVLALELEDADAEVQQVLLEVGFPARLIARRVVDSLWRCLKRRKQTVRYRARCLAQLLLMASQPALTLSREQPSSRLA